MSKTIQERFENGEKLSKTEMLEVVRFWFDCNYDLTVL